MPGLIRPRRAATAQRTAIPPTATASKDHDYGRLEASGSGARTTRAVKAINRRSFPEKRLLPDIVPSRKT
ncbi:hypothetical protein GCM10027256_32570 [Novispirillum itersonii subsp. nipponicum]